MKKAAIIITNFISLMLILNSMDIVNALALFVIAGRIPGTEWYLPAEFMTLVTVGTIGFFVGRLSNRFILVILEMHERLSAKQI
jgi:hypothetical protein